ncbi:MAG: hypothetical protein WDA47_03805 [Bacilli bacterium]
MPAVKDLMERELKGTDCEYCLKKHQIGHTKRFYCSVLKEFYFMGEKRMDRCWAAEYNLLSWIKSLSDIKEYIIGKGVSLAETKRIDKELEKFKSGEGGKLSASQLEGLWEAYMEDVHRGEPGGGGEKADRTHKPGAKKKKNRDEAEPYWEVWREKYFKKF